VKNLHPDKEHAAAVRGRNRADFLYVSAGPRDTLAAGRMLGAALPPGSVVGLTGELGAGKTCFIKGMACGINRTPEDEVTSPTFAILQEYAGTVPVYHVDAYRISGSDDLATIGLEDCMEAGGIVVIEWADRIMEIVPDEHLMISIRVISEHQRQFLFTPSGAAYRAAVKKLRDALAQQAVR
jgi:tRNA threonylcarbamoyladenosine biosynthesis protein TsaE